jgi:phosphoglycolate phosphatase-like HAD superfamily hydrolase
MEPCLILFDVDGTLIDTAGAGRRAMERAFEEMFEIDSLGERSSGVRFAGMTDHDIFDALAAVAGIDAALIDGSRRQLETSYLDALRREMERPDDRRRTIPGALPLLETLVGQDGVFLGLVTGNLEAGARTKLEPFGLNPFFPDGGFGSDHRDRREIARLAREKLSSVAGFEFPADSVVLVGDTEVDVESAKSNGFRSVAIESGWVPRELLLSSGADALFSDLTDQPRILEAFGLA